MFQLIGHEVLFVQQMPSLIRIPGWSKSGFDERIQTGLIPVYQGIFKQGDLRLLVVLLNRFMLELLQRRTVEHLPGHGFLF